MTKFVGLHAARGQIAWILALVVSTAVVVRLEQLELGSRLSALTANPLTESESAADVALEQARVRAADPATAEVPDQIRLLAALVLLSTQDGVDLDALRVEAAQTIADIESTASTDPVLLHAISLCRGVLRI